jgi:dTDP-glucose 4,6-dehydratase/UDP-glucose 4-epimerase
VKDARQTFLGIWIRNLIKGDPILVFGDGQQLRDFNYVDDVVDAIVRAAETPACYGRAYNLGHTEVIKLADLASMLCAMEPCATWRLVPFPPDRKVIDIGDYYSNHSLASSLLGWQPRISLDQGLARTLTYYRQQLCAYL